jgi:hypothetical protein
MSKLVKPFVSALQPVLPMVAGVAGSLLSALRIVLVTGGAATNVQTLTVASGVATATYAAAHSYIVGSVIGLSGADQSVFNDEFRVASVPTPNSITFPVGAPDGAATGSIICALASAGWEEVFTDGNVAVFRPTHVESSRLFVRVDDSGTIDARIVCYESMSDAHTGVNPFPTSAQMSGGLYWGKSRDSAAHHWVAFADHRGLYFGVEYTASSVRYNLNLVGEIAPYKSGDGWSWIITGRRMVANSTSTSRDGSVGDSNTVTANSMYLARSLDATPSPVPAYGSGAGKNSANSFSYSGSATYSTVSVYPNPANAGLLLCAVEVIDTAGVRGLFPGVLHARQDLNSAGFTTGLVLTPTEDLAGKKLMSVEIGNSYSTASNTSGRMFMDISGTWSR